MDEQVSGKRIFSMILRVKMISVLFYERKNTIFYEKNLKFTRNNTFINVFCNGVFLLLSLITNYLEIIGF